VSAAFGDAGELVNFSKQLRDLRAGRLVSSLFNIYKTNRRLRGEMKSDRHPAALPSHPMSTRKKNLTRLAGVRDCGRKGRFAVVGYSL